MAYRLNAHPSKKAVYVGLWSSMAKLVSDRQANDAVYAGTGSFMARLINVRPSRDAVFGGHHVSLG